jgi:hypothetical protein
MSVIENNMRIIRIVIIIILGLCISYALNAKEIHVKQGDNLQEKIDNALGGDVLLLEPGIYAAVAINSRNFSKDAFLTIKKTGSEGEAIIKGTGYSEGSAMDIMNSSYIIFKEICFEYGLYGIVIKHSNHLVFFNCIIRDIGQEAMEILDNTRIVDVIGGKIHDAGKRPGYAKWGEGIYVGGGRNLETTIVSDVWIEGIELFNCGKSEAVNFKANVKRSTIRNCYIHDIHPGTEDQYNEGAISVESGDVTSSRNDIWVENNTVFDVYGGRFNRGITFFGAGVVVKNNTVYNCEDIGIYGHSWMDQGFLNYVHGNTVHNCHPHMTITPSINVSYENPGTNPYSPQDWYKK